MMDKTAVDLAKKDQTEFGFEGIGIPAATVENVRKVLRLLRLATSLSVISEFLRSKRLPYSAGSWDDLEAMRILPAVQKGEVTLAELTQLLAEAEEYGRFHVFLYSARRKEAEQLMAPARIQNVCQRLGLAERLEQPLIEEAPAEPTLAEVRRETLNGVSCLVFKVVETRLEKRFLGEIEDERTVQREWEKVRVRAVNTARLHESGLVEVRIQSHLNSSHYESDLNQLWSLLREFVPPTLFAPLSLAKAKKQWWVHRDQLKQKIRFSDSKLQNSAGTTLLASTGHEEADLFGDPGAAASIDQFMDHGAHCDSSNVWFRPVEGLLVREIHVLLSGLHNEFAVPASCTKLEYEYVLNELRAYSR